MGRKGKFSRVKMKGVCLELLTALAKQKGQQGTAVGLDIAKKEIVVVVRWPDGSFERRSD